MVRKPAKGKYGYVALGSTGHGPPGEAGSTPAIPTNASSFKHFVSGVKLELENVFVGVLSNRTKRGLGGGRIKR